MISFIEPADREANFLELMEYFELRKQVFCDQLGWVETESEIEMDEFDEMFNVYVLYLDDETGRVNGGVRLMPTTGPTLTHQVWSDMLPDPEDFRSPNIWEATRFCVHEQSNASRKGNLANRATLCLSMAVAEFGAANGITHVIGVCEKKFFDMMSIYGGMAEVVSTRMDPNGLEIGLGIWPTDDDSASREWVRAFTGGAEPLILPREVA